jgi:hypothetical protein
VSTVETKIPLQKKAINILQISKNFRENLYCYIFNFCKLFASKVSKLLQKIKSSQGRKVFKQNFVGKELTKKFINFSFSIKFPIFFKLNFAGNFRDTEIDFC